MIHTFYENRTWWAWYERPKQATDSPLLGPFENETDAVEAAEKEMENEIDTTVHRSHDDERL